MENVFETIGAPEQIQQESLDLKKARWAKVIENASKATLLNLVSRINDGFSMVWENDELTPQQIVSALDTKALSVFKAHSDIVTFLLTKFPQLDGMIKLPPAWATIVYEVTGGVPTGKITIEGSPQ